jgi:hypothetical protein
MGMIDYEPAENVLRTKSRRRTRRLVTLSFLAAISVLGWRFAWPIAKAKYADYQLSKMVRACLDHKVEGPVFTNNAQLMEACSRRGAAYQRVTRADGATLGMCQTFGEWVRLRDTLLGNQPQRYGRGAPSFVLFCGRIPDAGFPNELVAFEMTFFEAKGGKVTLWMHRYVVSRSPDSGSLTIRDNDWDYAFPQAASDNDVTIYAARAVAGDDQLSAIPDSSMPVADRRLGIPWRVRGEGFICWVASGGGLIPEQKFRERFREWP